MEENSPDILWRQKAQKTCRKRHRRSKALQIRFIPAEEWESRGDFKQQLKELFPLLAPQHIMIWSTHHFTRILSIMIHKGGDKYACC